MALNLTSLQSELQDGFSALLTRDAVTMTVVGRRAVNPPLPAGNDPAVAQTITGILEPFTPIDETGLRSDPNPYARFHVLKYDALTGSAHAAVVRDDRLQDQNGQLWKIDYADLNPADIEDKFTLVKVRANDQ